MNPLKFVPILKSVLWGGTKITALKGMDNMDAQIGESWEISDVPGRETLVADGIYMNQTLSQLLAEHGAQIMGDAWAKRMADVPAGDPKRRFPLLIKFIDAARDLSIQVHPDDNLAWRRHRSLGKTEMWYAMPDCDPTAHIRIGWKSLVTPDEYRKLLDEHTIADALCDIKCRPGDVFYLPAGRVHAICSGTMVAEIQETSDITYRIYDYDRRDANGQLRPLHTEESIDAINYADIQPDYHSYYDKEFNRRNVAVESPYFTTAVIQLNASFNISYADVDSFVILICTEGRVNLTTTDAEDGDDINTLRAGETILLPATIQNLSVQPIGNATLLEVRG